MRRFLLSLILGLLLGALAGLAIGWLQPPKDTRSRQLSQLAQPHRDDYTVMIAAGYAHDGDLPGALERLQKLQIAEPANHLRHTTERIIRSASRQLDDIRALARLTADSGSGSTIMAPFLDAAGSSS